MAHLNVLDVPWRSPAVNTEGRPSRDQTNHPGAKDKSRAVPYLLRIGDARRVTVTAHLGSGLPLPTKPWPWLLDGLLATGWRIHTGLARQGDTHVMPLPLLALTPPSGPWCWAASAAHWEPSTPETRYWHRRQDRRIIADIADRPLKMPGLTGRYRPARMPQPTIVTPTVTWRAFGDPEWVQQCLAPLDYMTSDRGQGYGRVLRWEITDDGPAAPDTATRRDSRWEWADWVLWAAGNPSRPIPTKAAPLIGATWDGEPPTGVYRPPYWRTGTNCPQGPVIPPNARKE